MAIQRSVLSVAIMVLLLASCGGGGSASTPPTPPNSGNPTPSPPAPTPEPAAVGFTEADSGINYQHGYLTTPAETDRLAVHEFAGGAAAGDYDNDGDTDVFIVRGDIGPNLLYRNDGNGMFEDVADTAGVAFTKSATENYRHSGPTFADMDGDSDLDLFVGGIQGDATLIFQNNGDGTFTDVTATTGIDALTGLQNISAAFGDYDLDGDLDMFVAHWGTERLHSGGEDTESLWRNDGTGGAISFTNVSVPSGISATLVPPVDGQTPDTVNRDYTFAPSFARINDDRYPDLVITGDFETSRVYINDGDANGDGVADGTFTDVTDPMVITDKNGMGSALGDFDNDGDLDWFVTAIYGQQYLSDWDGNRFYRNDNGTFVDVTDNIDVVDGGWGWAACFMDFENDTDLDIYHTNGYTEFPESDISRAFVSRVSEGTHEFSQMSTTLGLDDSKDSMGVVCADFDRDGDVDILQLNRDADSAASYYRNDSTGNNYLIVKLNGRAPNTEAAGARIFATIGEVTQMREIIIGSNFTTQNPTEQVFGLGSSSQVDELRIEWPDGTEEVRTEVAAGQRIEITQ